jgi:hypothetical protein
MNPRYNTTDRRIAILEIIGALTIIGYWIGWYADLLKSIGPTNELYDIYYAFESSFLLPDSSIIIFLVILAVGIFKQSEYGKYYGIAAGGGLLFLALIDICFYINYNIYQYDLLLIPINLACLGGSMLLISRFGWFHSRNQIDRQF